MKIQVIHRRGTEDAEFAQTNFDFNSADLCATPFLCGEGCCLFHASRLAPSAVEQLT